MEWNTITIEKFYLIWDTGYWDGMGYNGYQNYSHEFQKGVPGDLK